MKFKLLITIFFSITFLNNAQSKYFVKFKDNLPQKDCEILLNESINKVSQTTLNKHTIIRHKSFSEKFQNIDNLEKLFTIEITDADNRLLSILENDANVEYIQKVLTYKVDEIPSDSLYSQQWGIQSIKAESAWDLVPQNSNKILLAVIDTGIDYLHPDLKNQIYINKSEVGIDQNGNDKKSNGIDDDKNGFIDDFQGWDFVNKINIYPANMKDDFTDWDNDPNDEHGHGTNIAGVIGAEHNTFGIAGVNPNIEIMNLRAFDKNGNGEEDDAASAIIYAVKMGAKIINMSWGDSEFSQVLKDVIYYANSQGVLLVGSSGNSGSNLPHYPSGFSPVVSVGAIQQNEVLASFSNYGSTLDLVSPGSQIITSGLDNTYKTVSGTSVSAPFVSAAASIILSFNNYNSEELKQILKTTCKDLGEPGWDEKYGAGTLNLEKAVKLSIPSKIAINFPQNDYHTSGNELNVNVSCVSPYFKNYELYYGVSYNPESWQKINLENNEYQIVNENIHIFDLTNLIDTVYTIRLLVNTIDNNTFEERSSFIIDRTAPVIISHSLSPAMLNDIETVQASIITNENVTAQLFYRTQNSDENFKSLYLDGFSQDVKVVSDKNFGILPISEVLAEVNHEFYFEVTNQAGLKTILKDGANYFKSENVIENNIQNRDFNELSLPTGRIFTKTVNFAGFNSNFVLLNETSTSADLSIYEIQNQNFAKMSSLKNRIPISVGDFNNDGKTDILNLFVQRGFIETQKSVGSLEFETVFSDTSGNFWPALAENIDDDSITEIIVFSSDTTIAVWEVQSDFNLTLGSELKIFSSGENQNGKSIFRNNQVVVGDFDNDNKNEIVAADNFGRLIVYEIANNNSFKNDFIVETFYTIESNTLISKGDFNGDGIMDVGIISQFENNEFITPLIYTSVLTFKENKSEILFQTMLITTENKFISSFEKSYSAINFADLNNDSKDELIIFSNPNAYVFENYLEKANLVFYQTNVNSQSIFAGDLDGNQILEIAIPDEERFSFIEFQNNRNLKTPIIGDYYSLDSTQTFLSWNDSGLPTKIFRSLEKDNLILCDSTTLNYFTDSVQANQTYYYSVQFYNSENEFSALSKTISIFAHAPAFIENIKVINNKNLEVTYSLPIDVNNLRISNFLIDEINPSSISITNENTLSLTNESTLENGEHIFSFSKLRDFYNAPIQDSTISFQVNIDQNVNEELIISSYEIIDNYNIIIRYNFSIDPLSSLNINNYTLSPNNMVKEIIYEKGKNNSVLLTTDKPFGSIGREYILSIKNVFSSAETGYLPISENSGSQIILTSNSSNLDGIYVYPNPVNVDENQALTFANLTQFVEIYIFNLEGKLINQLNEDDGNGGLTWNLQDEKGSKIPSGIYIYKAISKDSQGNELQEKIAKFAVTR